MKYSKTLKNRLLPFMNELRYKKFVFQQNNAAIHKSKLYKSWILQQKIDVLEWPSERTDPNSIENVWNYLTGMVYQNGKQYQSVQNLRMIFRAWQGKPPKYLISLIGSMPHRCLEFIVRKKPLIYHFLKTTHFGLNLSPGIILSRFLVCEVLKKK